MYRVDRNNFYSNMKGTKVYTPSILSNFLFSILSAKIKKGLIFDPCVGKGSLLIPWQKNAYSVLGIDIEDQGFKPTLVRNYLEIKEKEADFERPALIIMNPPFNIEEKTKTYIKEHYTGRPLLSEIWLSKAINLFGVDLPIVLFTPYGFRLNQTSRSKRWRKFQKGEYPEISSIISLPKNLFENVLFHSEVLIFNVAGLKGHYFCNV